MSGLNSTLLPKVRSPEYTAFYGMWNRCTNPKYPKYEAYKLRRPPDSWRDFKVFLAEVGQRPSPKHSLDRIDNKAPYGPGNVRWATSVQQNSNKENNRRLTYKGVTHTVTEWATLFKIPRMHIYNRIYSGWSVERIFKEL